MFDFTNSSHCSRGSSSSSSSNSNSNSSSNSLNMALLPPQNPQKSFFQDLSPPLPLIPPPKVTPYIAPYKALMRPLTPEPYFRVCFESFLLRIEVLTFTNRSVSVHAEQSPLKFACEWLRQPACIVPGIVPALHQAPQGSIRQHEAP